MSHSSSFSKAEKTPYNRHFPRSFLLNYGGALQDPREDAILKRLHDFNCEWLNRPNIAISELAQTVRENIPLLKQYKETVLVPDFIDEYLGYFEALQDALSRLDNKDKSTSQPPTREDVISLLRTLDCEADLEACIIDGLNVAGSLFMLSVHLLAPLTLMRNPEDFAEKCRRTQAAQHFKDDPTSRRMRDYILDSITKRRRPVSRGSVWDISEEEDNDEEPPSRRRSKQTTKASARKSARSTWEEEEQHSNSPSRRRSRPTTRSVTRKRRRQDSHSSPETRLSPPDVDRRTSRRRIVPPVSASSSSKTAQKTHFSPESRLSSPDVRRPIRTRRVVPPVSTSSSSKTAQKSSKKITTKQSELAVEISSTSSSSEELEQEQDRIPVKSNTPMESQPVSTLSRKRTSQPFTTGTRAPAQTSKPILKTTQQKTVVSAAMKPSTSPSSSSSSTEESPEEELKTAKPPPKKSKSCTKQSDNKTTNVAASSQSTFKSNQKPIQDKPPLSKGQSNGKGKGNTSATKTQQSARVDVWLDVTKTQGKTK